VWPDHGGSPINIMLILMSIFLFLGALVLHWYILNDWWILKRVPTNTKQNTKNS
jgi:hypothetical protein